MLRTRALALAACACMATACASSTSVSSAGTICRSSLPSDRTPLNETLDSAALVAEVAALWEPIAGLTVGRLRYDTLGMFDTAYVISEAMSVATQERLALALSGRARPVGEPEELVSLVLGDSSGPGPRRVPDLRACPPVLTNDSQIQRLLIAEARALDEAGHMPADGVTAISVLRMFVDTEGRVTELRVHESSGRIPIDEAAVRIMREAVFIPARTEGIPWGAWVQIPVRFVMRGPVREPMFLPPPDFRD